MPEGRRVMSFGDTVLTCGHDTAHGRTVVLATSTGKTQYSELFANRKYYRISFGSLPNAGYGAVRERKASVCI
jgi:hypothetical protein